LAPSHQNGSGTTGLVRDYSARGFLNFFSREVSMCRKKKENLEELVNCCVKNCQAEVKKKDAIYIDGYTFCRECGPAYLNSTVYKDINNLSE